MKLKKIASLALAGVMAVSMLAGCAETNANSTPNPNPAPVESGAADVTAAVESYVSGTPTYVTYAGDAELGADLEFAVEYVGVREILHSYINNINLEQPWVGPGLDFVDELEKGVGVTYYTSEGNARSKKDTIWEIGDNKTLVAVESEAQNSETIEDARAVEAFVISSEIGQNAINKKIAEEIQSTVNAYQRHVDNSSDFEFAGGNFNFNYTVSVSTYTKSVNSTIEGSAWGFEGAENPDVTFVAIQVVRTATEQ